VYLNIEKSQLSFTDNRSNLFFGEGFISHLPGIYIYYIFGAHPKPPALIKST